MILHSAVYCTPGVCVCRCVFVEESRRLGWLWVTAGAADVLFQDTPRAPAINDDNLNFDTSAFAEATGQDESRKSPF